VTLEGSDDPGWRPIIRRLPILFVPVIGFLRFNRGRPRDHLLEFRLIFIGVVGALWLFLYGLFFIVPSDRWWKTDRVPWFLAVVIGIGILGQIRIRALRRGQLDLSSEERLAASFKTKVFIGFGSAEIAALAAFVGTFLMHALWICPIGLAFSTVGFVRVGPTKREIARRQRQIADQGSTLSLLDALAKTPPPGWRKRAPGTQSPPAA
jgi:hypothetical protein